MSAESADSLLGRWLNERMIETPDEPLDDYGMRLVRAIRMQFRARLEPPRTGARHPVADAFGFAREYAEAAALRLPKGATAEAGSSLLEVEAGDRCRLFLTQVGGRIIARIEIIRHWDREALAESDGGTRPSVSRETPGAPAL